MQLAGPVVQSLPVLPVVVRRSKVCSVRQYLNLQVTDKQHTVSCKALGCQVQKQLATVNSSWQVIKLAASARDREHAPKNNCNSQVIPTSAV